MKITSEIFQVGGSGYTSGNDGAVYLLHLHSRAALIDSGTGNSHDQLMANIRECGVNPRKVELLLLTHCHYDHTGGAHQIKQETGCEIVAHKLAAPFIEKGDNAVTAASWYGAKMTPVKVDEKLTGEHETLLVGGREIEAIHIPGHSPGSVAYLLESDGKMVLFGQDVHGPLDKTLRSDERLYKESLKKLISLHADILCEGHYGVFIGKDKVRKFIESFL